jgi:prepilin-type N-terminal cleavage/methylation domain-containing protein
MQASNRKQQGFTLVEVIVVAVIVAALAAVSVPLYLNYVTSSRANAAANAAGSVASFMGACSNQGGNIIEDIGDTLTDTTISCVYGVSQDTTTVSIPRGINLVISAENSPGTVGARHAEGGDPAEYRF